MESSACANSSSRLSSIARRASPSRARIATSAWSSPGSWRHATRAAAKSPLGSASTLRRRPSHARTASRTARSSTSRRSACHCSGRAARIARRNSSQLRNRLAANAPAARSRTLGNPGKSPRSGIPAAPNSAASIVAPVVPTAAILPPKVRSACERRKYSRSVRLSAPRLERTPSITKLATASVSAAMAACAASRMPNKSRASPACGSHAIAGAASSASAARAAATASSRPRSGPGSDVANIVRDRPRHDGPAVLSGRPPAPPPRPRRPRPRPRRGCRGRVRR